MADEPRIVLIPSVPEDPALDVLFETDAGFAVTVIDADVQALQAQGIAVMDLYASADDYVASIQDLNSDEALAAIQNVQSQALAALDPGNRGQFSVA